MTGIESSELGWRDVLWSVAVGIAAAFLLFPLFASIAHGQPLDVEPEAVGLGITALVVLWSVLLAMLTEWIRGFVPAWRRGVKADESALAAVDAARSLGLAGPQLETLRRLAVSTGGPGDGAKAALRVVPVAFGVAAPAVMTAFGVDQTYNPGLVGGLLAGLCAAQWGGSIVKAVRDRLPGAQAKRLPGGES